MLLGVPPIAWRTLSILLCNAVRRMGTCKWGCSRWMVLLWCSSRSQGCKSSLYSCFEPHACLSQVPIITKADCMKNMEENGLGFTEGVLCAGGNTNGTCQVWKKNLFGEKDKKYILASSTSSQCIKIHRVIAEEPWRQKMGCWLVLSVLQDQTSVGRWCFSICPLCVLKWLERFEINIPFVNFKATFTGKCLRPVYRDCCIHDLDQRNYTEDGRHAGMWSCVWGEEPRRSVFSRHICQHRRII